MRCDATPELVEMLLDYPESDFDIADYAIRNLGWVEVHADRDGGEIQLRFRALTVAYEAVLAAHELLSAHDWQNVLLTYDLFGWISESHSDGRAAAHRLTVIVKAVLDFFRHPTYTAKEVGVASLLRDTTPAGRRLASVLGLWRGRSGELPDDLARYMRDGGLLPRVMLIDVESGDAVGRFRYVGHGFTVYGAAWPHEAIGRRIEDQPDTQYGARVKQSCMRAMRTGGPLFEHVDASIAQPGMEPTRSRYKCLKTLWQTARGQNVLMITSVLTPDIEVPLIQ